MQRKVPLRVSYSCTYRCNLRCKYCGLWKTKREEMTTNQAKSMIDDFASAGTLFFMFTGGEPLLRRDISDLVSRARSKGMVVGLVTNGTLLKRRLDELSDLSYLVVSLDGPEELNDSLRGRGSYEKALDSIRAAVDIGFDVTINSVLSKENTENGFEGLKTIVSLSKELGTKANFSVLYEDFANKGVSTLSEKEVMAALNFIREQKKTAKIVMSDACIDALATTKKWKTCHAGKLFCDVAPDGMVIPCLFKQEGGINGLEHGFVNAFGMLGQEKACSCSSTCYNELNSTLRLRPRAVLENFIKYSRFLLG